MAKRSKNSPGRGRPARARIYAQLDGALSELRDQLGGLPTPAKAHGIWDEIWVHEVHHSTAIEGNTLVLSQVDQLLRSGRAVGDKQLAEYLEVLGYAQGARWVYQQALEPGHEPSGELLTMTEVRHVHRMAMSAVWEVAPHPDATESEAPGSFRRHDIRAFPGGMTPPSHALVDARMRGWLDALPAAVSALARETPGYQMESLAAAHAEFERIHPFLDGNGRAGRLLLNLALTRSGYPPAIIRRRDRNRYLSALRAADADKPGALAELLARAVLDNLYRFVVPAVAGPSRLVPLASLVTREASLIALRNAAQRGRLRAQRGEDGQWRSTRAWVDDYLASRYRRSAGQADRRTPGS